MLAKGSLFGVVPGTPVRASACPSCAQLYMRDVAAIFRSGVFDAPPDTSPSSMMFLTLTAPSFGAVHRVPGRTSEQFWNCKCGATHGASAQHLRGIPLDVDTYRYEDAVAWNNGVGPLWDSTQHRLERELGNFEYAVVREWQMRGVLHFHVILRLERYAIPAMVARVAQAATAVVPWTGVEMHWGEQVDCQLLTPTNPDKADSVARTMWYLGKALTYSVKALGRPALASKDGIGIVHLKRLSMAAGELTCGADGCTHGRKAVMRCYSAPHRAFGARSRPYHVSRGWSYTSLTRKKQAEARKQWAIEHHNDAEANSRYEERQRMRGWARDIRVHLGLQPDVDETGTRYRRRKGFVRERYNRVDTETGELLPNEGDLPERPPHYDDWQWDQFVDWWRDDLTVDERCCYRRTGIPPGTYFDF